MVSITSKQSGVHHFENDGHHFGSIFADVYDGHAESLTGKLGQVI
ncbi:MAG: hypothetical protein VB142_07050 [Burkholderia sp.]